MLDNIELVDRINNLLDTKGLSKNKLITDCELSPNCFTKWKQGTYPNSTTLYNVSRYLNVSMEYLLTGETPVDVNALELVQNYNKLSERDKKIIDSQIKLLSTLD